jgi:hypothetical protein
MVLSALVQIGEDEFGNQSACLSARQESTMRPISQHCPVEIRTLLEPLATSGFPSGVRTAAGGANDSAAQPSRVSAVGCMPGLDGLFEEAGNGLIDDLRMGDGSHMPQTFELDNLYSWQCSCQ